MELTNIFILSLFHHGNKVRYSTLTHLLKGRRTTSILIYGFFNQLLPYFSLLPTCQEEELVFNVKKLAAKGLLTLDSDQLVQLTPQGKKTLTVELPVATTALNSFLYGRVDDMFIELLLFASQAISEYSHSNKIYIPIETNPVKQLKIKQWFSSLSATKEELSHSFFEEWHSLLMHFPREQRETLIKQLSGHQQIGQTYKQIMEARGLSNFELFLERKNTSHAIITLIKENTLTFPYFYRLFQLVEERTVNESASRSYGLFLNGLTTDQIATRRHLRLSTVTDHLIEGAIIDPAFPFERILSELTIGQLDQERQKQIDIRNWRFGDYVTLYPELTFLEFRCYQIWRLRGDHR